MQPELDPTQIAPDLIGIGAQSVVDNAQRLGIEWALRLATVINGADPTAISAIYDGDSVPIDMTSTIGSLGSGQRVYVIVVPPSGNFIIGRVGRFEARQTMASATASVTFNNIPVGIRTLKLQYRVRSDNAVTVQTMNLRINGSSAGVYSYEYLQATNITPTAVSASAQTSGVIGLCPGTSTPTGRFGTGEVTFVGWDVTQVVGPSSTALGWLHGSQAIGTAVAAFVAQYGGGVYDAIGPYISLTVFPQAGNFDIGSDFQLVGEPS